MVPHGYAQLSGSPIQYSEIPAGAAGTEATIAAMQQLAKQGSVHPEVIDLARQIVKHVPSKDYKGEAKALFKWVKRFVKYRMDPRTMETVQHPYETALVQGAGDCDDHATLLVALALALGHGGSFRTVKADPDRPDEYSHVYAVIGIREGASATWYPADTTVASSSFGWEPPSPPVIEYRDWLVVSP